jgi:Na+/melibiose symporter-like transporter
VLGLVSIPKERKAVDLALLPQIDWIGAFLFTTSLLLLLVALSQGNSAGWKTVYVIALLIISVFLFVGFVFWQRYLEFRTAREPLIRTSVFQNSPFLIAMVIFTLFAAAFTNYLIYSTYFYQEYLLLDTLHTAFRFIPLGIVGICIATMVCESEAPKSLLKN